MISVYITNIGDGIAGVGNLLEQEFKINPGDLDGEIKSHLAQLKDECYLLIETPYVDKVYRNSYYHYYSSKFGKYKRDCIRISIFGDEIKEEDFRDSSKIEKLKEIYYGFIILRPTPPNIIGRSFISPKALKVANFKVCLTKISTTVNSVKLIVEGFPHSSQDTETISCAETSIWAIMEYFSSKYTEYKPVLPSKIIEVLNRVSFERQIPSSGLNIDQISFALREFGFGTKIYSKASYNNDFKKLLSCYIESGIPLVIAIDDSASGGTTGHALLVIGHEIINPKAIDSLKISTSNQVSKNNKRSLSFYDYNDLDKDYIFIDDNHPIFQKASFNKPALHYSSADWDQCEITYFIAPLYPKIYLEAYEARSFILQFLAIGPNPIKAQDFVLRFYLTSSRSYKDKLAVNNSFETVSKTFILESEMPKFIWVAEISTKYLIKKREANGLVILDATEANILNNKPLILAVYEGRCIYYDYDDCKMANFEVTPKAFSFFENNLKTV